MEPAIQILPEGLLWTSQIPGDRVMYKPQVDPFHRSEVALKLFVARTRAEWVELIAYPQDSESGFSSCIDL